MSQQQESINRSCDLPSTDSSLSSQEQSEQQQEQEQQPNLEDSPQSKSKEASPSLKVVKPKKKSKKLCHYKSCTSPHSIIGDCSFCFKKFCTRHRLLEAHDCEHYREVKNEYHERNAKQLQSQQTVVSKV